MTSCTENYECLVLDNTSKSNRIEDCVFWYKAKMRKNFRVGSPALWAAHNKNYTRANGNAKNDPNAAMRNRNSQKVSIKKLS